MKATPAMNVLFAGFPQLVATGLSNADSAKSSFSYALEVAVMRAIDYVTAQPGIDPTRIVLEGSSAGAWCSLFTAALDPRISCVDGVRIAGGLDGQMGISGSLQARSA